MSRPLPALALLALVAAAQVGEESYQIEAQPPRLLVRPQRLRLLKRERERKSMRWEQFETLMAGRARMPEPGFALALWHQVTGDREAARRATEWALGPADDLRQLALVMDWCGPAMEPAQATALAAKLQRGIERAGPGVGGARNRTFAAIALADHQPKTAASVLRAVIRDWWRGQVVPGLKSGRAIPREDHYALLEVLHAVRDNTGEDLREAAPWYFKDFPLYRLMSYYPAPYPAPENEYRIPASVKGEPDLAQAALSRAAELAMVAFEPNAQETQFLQGWALNDRFLMRGAFGIAYEFLWANPYHPGLSFYNLPRLFHDQRFGRLFLRSSWDDDAQWLGYFGGRLQKFENGRPATAKPPIRIGDVLLLGGSPRFDVKQQAGALFIVGLKARSAYDVEVDDEEMREEWTDVGGILRLPAGTRGGIRLRERQRVTPSNRSSSPRFE